MESKTLHLSLGSSKPTKTDKIRLYSFEYCPYAQRIRLILQAKGLEYEVVNINLKKKPEWYSSIHSEEKVPVLEIGNEIIAESLDIANYLDEKFPTIPLYPKEIAEVEKDKKLIEKINGVTSVFGKCLTDPKQKTSEEWMKEFVSSIEPFENNLKEKNTNFFGGDKPGMVDYMLWPWAERIKTLNMVIGEDLSFSEHIPTLIKWQKCMLKEPAVIAVYNGPEKFFKAVQIKYSEEENADFDSI